MGKSSFVIGGLSGAVLLRRGSDGAFSLSKALWVGGGAGKPFVFAAPDAQRSHPTARGQSTPDHV